MTRRNRMLEMAVLLAWLAGSLAMAANSEQRHVTEDDVIAMIVQAAAFPRVNEDKSAHRPPRGVDEWENQTLSVLMLSLKPLQLHSRCALSVSDDAGEVSASAKTMGGSSTFFPKEYLSDPVINRKQNEMTGRVNVKAQGYEGFIEFVARWEKDQWKLSLLRIPGYPTCTRTSPDGLWRIETDRQSLGALREWAQAGDAEAQIILGRLLTEGKEVEQDTDAALRYFDKATADPVFGRKAAKEAHILRKLQPRTHKPTSGDAR